VNAVFVASCLGGLCLCQIDSVDGDTAAMKALESKDVQNRRDASMYFQLMRSKKAIPALLKALKDPDPIVRRNVANAFWWLGEDSKPAVPSLAALLHDDDVEVRRAAARTLLELGLSSKEAIPTLLEAKNDSDKVVRIYAGTAIVGLGEQDEKALRFLLEFSTARRPWAEARCDACSPR
jgi:HEAT repeat protein